LIALQLCRWQFLYNETLQQTSHSLRWKLCERWQMWVFDPHFEEVRSGIEPWLMARWKAHVRLPIRHNWTFFASSYRWCATRQNVSELTASWEGVGQFEPRFQGEGVVPWEYFWFLEN